MNYSLAYRIGFHPWEDAEEQPSFTDKFSALLDREESGRQPPYGPALDVGTGSGIWGIKLAQRGWQVTGVDIVDKALRRARPGAGSRCGHAPRPGRCDGASGDENRHWIPAGARHRDVPRPHRCRARGDGPGGKRNRRARRHRADDRVGAQAQRTAAAGCEPQRDRGCLPRMERDRRGGVWFRGAEARRTADEARGALVPAPSQVTWTREQQ
jgi:hypothetical protein